MGGDTGRDAVLVGRGALRGTGAVVESAVREDFAGKKISIIGAARSGIAAARVLKELGATVLLADSQPEEKFTSSRLAEIRAIGVEVLNPPQSAA